MSSRSNKQAKRLWFLWSFSGDSWNDLDLQNMKQLFGYEVHVFPELPRLAIVEGIPSAAIYREMDI